MDGANRIGSVLMVNGSQSKRLRQTGVDVMDSEKVIKGLEQCKEGGSCDGCKYDIQSSKCIFLLHADVLALLKEQETEIRQLKFALDIAKGTCKGIKMEGR